ncbi:MAG TPA: hypothetical protein DIV79_00665 [Opitutae bacterium]|nr:hypothetical protein [Opitutae bacterium]
MKPEDFSASGLAKSQSSNFGKGNEFWNAAFGELVRGKSVLLTIVASCRKGSPGTPGAKMLLLEDGRKIGTIGGGIMEARALDQAQAALVSDYYQPRLEEVDHWLGSKRPSGLICGGGQSNVTARLSPNQDLDTIRGFISDGISDTPSSLEISPRGIRLANQNGSPLFSQRLFQEGESWKFEFGSVNLRRCVIYGAGHCGQALARQLRWLGYKVEIFDARPEQRAKLATLGIESSSIGLPSESLVKVRFPQNASAIVMTHSYESDVEALGFALKQDFPFIGLMGSPPKLERIRKSLTGRGINRAQIDRITCPVGIEIGSDTPEEIAVSVAAQILQREKIGQ